MKNIEIQVNSKNNQVIINNDTLGISSENLQGKIIFKPEPFIEGTCRMYIEGRGSILMQKEEDFYTLDILSSLLKEPSLDICFKITEPENEKGIPIFCSKIIHFKVLDTIETEGDIPEEYPSWEQILDSKIAEIEALEEDVEEAEVERNRTVQEAIKDLDEVAKEVGNLNIDVSDKVDGDVAVMLTKKDGTTKTVVLSDGTSLMFHWDGTRLGIKTDEDEEYTYVDLQGIQGPVGPKGEAFTIKKTYSSVTEMNADFNNMQLGDYVMIASTVEVEDNAKLYTRGEQEWIYISDFSGAQGIKGETGATPNIQIGTVVSGDTPGVTRSGTNENPVFNFTLVPGQKGDTGATGQTGATGNGIVSIEKTGTNVLVDTYTITYTNGNTTIFTVTNAKSIVSIVKTSTAGLVDTYTITYNDGTTSTFEITNGQDGEVTQEQLDEVQEQVTDIQEFIESELDKETTEKSTRIDVTNATKWYSQLPPTGRTEQKTYTGRNLLLIVPAQSITQNGVTLESYGDGSFRVYGTSTNIATIDMELPEIIQLPNETLYWHIRNNVINNNVALALVPAGGGTQSQPAFTQLNRIMTSASLTNMNARYLGVRVTDTQVTVDITFTPSIELSGDVTDYEPYVGGQPSPNPDYPQPIENVEGRSCRNFFNINAEKETLASVYKYHYYLKPNTSYTVSSNIPASSTASIYANSGQSTNRVHINYPQTIVSDSEGYFYISVRYKPTADAFDAYSLLEDGTNYLEINEGSTALPYEPYFEGKRLEFVVCNKNLFDSSTATSGAIYANGTIMSSSVMSSSDFIEIHNFAKIAISGDTSAESRTWNSCFFDKDKNVVSGGANGTNSSAMQSGRVFTIPDNAYYIRFCFANSWKDIMVEASEVKTTYEEHKQQIIPFPLAEGQKLMEGDYLAEDGVHHVREKIVLDGTENFQKRNNLEHTFQITLGKTSSSGKCSHYQSINSSSFDVDNGIYLTYTKALIISDLRFSTVADFKSWLATQYANGAPVTIEYVIRNEEVIDPYTPAQQEAYNKLMNLKLYKGVNHIWTNADGLEPNMQLTYYKSNKLRLDNIEARLELLEE